MRPASGGRITAKLLLTTDAVGGVWDYALTLARGLTERGAEVLLAVVGPPPDAARTAAAERVPGLSVVRLDGQLEWMDGGLGCLERLRCAAAQLAADWHADLIHVNQLGLAWVGDDAPRSHLNRRPPVLLGVHSDLATWWKWVKVGGREPSTLPHYLEAQRELAAQALRRADAVVCPSRFLAGELARCHGLATAPAVVHNAVQPLTALVPRPPREPDLAAVVGRAWDEAKNVGLVAQALPHCRRPWRVEVAGDLAEPGRGAAQPPGAAGLTYRGFLDKPALSRLFLRASVCIAPSSYEPFGLAAAEAAQAGCAVVANDVPSYREVWGDAAAYFRRNDPVALAALLDDLAGDPDRVGRLAAAARRRVAERYTPAQMAGAYLTLYRRLLGRPPGPRAHTGASSAAPPPAAPARGKQEQPAPAAGTAHRASIFDVASVPASQSSLTHGGL